MSCVGAKLWSIRRRASHFKALGAKICNSCGGDAETASFGFGTRSGCHFRARNQSFQALAAAFQARADFRATGAVVMAGLDPAIQAVRLPESVERIRVDLENALVSIWLPRPYNACSPQVHLRLSLDGRVKPGHDDQSAALNAAPVRGAKFEEYHTTACLPNICRVSLERRTQPARRPRASRARQPSRHPKSSTPFSGSAMIWPSQRRRCEDGRRPMAERNRSRTV